MSSHSCLPQAMTTASTPPTPMRSRARAHTHTHSWGKCRPGGQRQRLTSRVLSGSGQPLKSPNQRRYCIVLHTIT